MKNFISKLQLRKHTAFMLIPLLALICIAAMPTSLNQNQFGTGGVGYIKDGALLTNLNVHTTERVYGRLDVQSNLVFFEGVSSNAIGFHNQGGGNGAGLGFKPGGTARWYITSDGTHSLKPTADVTHNIGSPSLRVLGLYVQDVIGESATFSTNVFSAATNFANYVVSTNGASIGQTAVFPDLAASQLLVLNSDNEVATIGVSTAEAGYLSGVTSALQTQLNARSPAGSDGEIQYKSGGSFAASANLTFDGSILTTLDISARTLETTEAAGIGGDLTVFGVGLLRASVAANTTNPSVFIENLNAASSGNQMLSSMSLKAQGWNSTASASVTNEIRMTLKNFQAAGVPTAHLDFNFRTNGIHRSSILFSNDGSAIFPGTLTISGSVNRGDFAYILDGNGVTGNSVSINGGSLRFLSLARIRYTANGGLRFLNDGDTAMVSAQHNLTNQVRTTDMTLVATNSGTVFNNIGAGAQVTFTLPTAADGMWFGFYVDAAQTVVVDAAGTDTIRHVADVSSAGGTFTSGAQYSYLEIWCVSAGKWIVKIRTGTWTSA